jgi:LysR family transcriptional regulator, transcriptional activator of nhaA
MEWINYHHLLYFWLVSREESLARASVELRLAQSTVSKQIHQLEQALGHSLFIKKGRKLALTDSGRVVFRYAEEIFGLGRELLDTLGDRPVGKPLRITIGIADIVPKIIVEHVLAPAMNPARSIRLICREDRPDRLLADLALHELDVILTDAPASPHLKIRAFNHLLGGSEIAFFGCPALASRYRRNFPKSLNDAPVLLPTENTAMRRSLEQWFVAHDIRPLVVGEFEDSALLQAFGHRGIGIFPAAAVVSKEIEAQYKVRLIGKAAGVRENLYAITVERRIKNPAVADICHAAASWFAASGGITRGRTPQ